MELLTSIELPALRRMNGFIWMKSRFAISGSEVSDIFGQRLQLWMNHAYGHRKDIYVTADMLCRFQILMCSQDITILPCCGSSGFVAEDKPSPAA